MSKQTVITNNAEETKALGASVVKSLHEVNIIALHGELGSGKTTFVQGIAEGLGIKKRIISPTFIIIRKYEVPKFYFSSEVSDNERSREIINKSSRRAALARTINLYHIDLYRLEDDAQMNNLGLSEIIEDPSNLVVIEWAERMGNLLPQKRIDISFEYVDGDKRKVSFHL